MHDLFAPGLFHAMLWFSMGIMAYRIVAIMLNYIHAASFLREINLHIINLLLSIEDDLNFIDNFKYKRMEEAGFAKEEVSSIRKLDEHFLMNWKAACIHKFYSILPRKLHATIPFRLEDWEAALRVLNDTYKEKE